MRIRVAAGTVAAGGIGIEQFVTALGPWVDRIVVDNTGLTGNFDVDLHWTPEQPAQGVNAPPPDAPPPPIDQNWPSLFTAVREQLGLKLESRKAPVDVRRLKPSC